MGTTIIEWVKTHLTIVVCSTLGLVSVAMLVLGFLDKEVSAYMTRDARMYQNLRNLRPPNEAIIHAAKDELRKNQSGFEEALRKQSERSGHKPLIDDAFPEPSLTAPFRFREEYGKKQRQLLGLLGALDRPSPDEIEKEQKYLGSLENLAETERSLGVGGARGPAGGQPGFRRTPGAYRDTRDSEGKTFAERSETDAELRVSVDRAREIYCYASPESLDNRADPRKDPRPSVDLMWYAQMSLWLQEDVIRALAQLNEDTATTLRENGVEPWVGNLPVKHLRQIAVGDYVPQLRAGMRGASGASGGHKDLMPPGDASMVFTEQGSDTDVDVIQFGIDLVVEAAKLPIVIDAVCGAGFYTPLLVNYETIEPNLEMVGYIYGNDPVINVQLQFEGCFMRSEFAKLMPESIKTAIQDGEARIEGGRRRGTGGDRYPSQRPGGGRPSRPRRGGGPIAS